MKFTIERIIYRICVFGYLLFAASSIFGQECTGCPEGYELTGCEDQYGNLYPPFDGGCGLGESCICTPLTPLGDVIWPFSFFIAFYFIRITTRKKKGKTVES